MTSRLTRVFALSGLLLTASAAASGSAPRDLVVLAEVSGASGDQVEAAGAFVDALRARLTEDSRLALIAFDDRAQVIESLGNAPESADHSATQALRAASAPGATGVNTAGALERAIYELRVNGRAAARKVILVIGNGAIDTGDKARDAGLNAWVRDDLAKESKQAGIRIFWLTTSESADYQLVQTVTSDTGGDYYRGFSSAERTAALERLLDETSVTTATIRSGPTTSVTQTPPASLLPLAAGALAGLGLLATAGVLVLRRRAEVARAATPHRHAADGRQRIASRVELRDISGFTGRPVYDITGKRTYIGRQPREVTRSNFVIVIPDQAISRSHANIEFKDNGYWINDTSSVNGTYVNERRLTTSHLLRNGDHIRFAKFEFEFALVPAPRDDNAEPGTADPHTTTHTGDDDRTLIRPRGR